MLILTITRIVITTTQGNICAAGSANVDMIIPKPE